MVDSINLTVISPVLNEEFFLPLYLEAVSQYADEVLLLDGGSTDRSLDIIKEFQKKGKIRVCWWQLPQEGLPYSSDWNEGKRRNFLLEKAKGKWILSLDADEFLSDNFASILEDIVLPDKDNITYGFSFIPFWKDVNTVRISVPSDPRWEGYIYRLVRNGFTSYDSRGNHSLHTHQGQPIYLCKDKKLLPEVTLFHYHYALGPRLKFNDNRRGDLGCIDNKGIPDWQYRPHDYPVRLRNFAGKHPLVIRNYLKGGRR